MQRLPSLSRRQGYSKPAGENHNRAPKTGVSSRPATATSDHRPLGSRWLGSVSPRRRRPISLAFATRFANSSARSRDSPSVPSRDRNAEIGQYGRSSGSPFSHGQQRRSLSVEGCTPHDRGPRVRIPFAPAESYANSRSQGGSRTASLGRAQRRFLTFPPERIAAGIARASSGAGLSALPCRKGGLIRSAPAFALVIIWIELFRPVCL